MNTSSSVALFSLLFSILRPQETSEILKRFASSKRYTIAAFHNLDRFRINIYDLALEEAKLVDHVIATYFVTSRLACSKLCSKEPRCKSLNFCGKSECELSHKDSFDQSANNSLIHATGCAYLGMRNTTRPFCYDRGTELDIRNDTEPDLCGIKLKRVDAKLTSTDKAVVDDGYEYKESQVHQCTDAFHGGKECPENIVLEWLRYEKHMFVNWTEAVEFCETAYRELPGRLFGEVDGTVQQMEWFVEKLEFPYFWLGIIPDTGNWVTTAGNDVTDKIISSEHKFYDLGPSTAVSYERHAEGALIEPSYFRYPFICQISF